MSKKLTKVEMEIAGLLAEIDKLDYEPLNALYNKVREKVCNMERAYDSEKYAEVFKFVVEQARRFKLFFKQGYIAHHPDYDDTFFKAVEIDCKNKCVCFVTTGDCDDMLWFDAECGDGFDDYETVKELKKFFGQMKLYRKTSEKIC